MSPIVRRPPGMELALLGYLRHGPVHGYQLHRLISDPDGLGPIWHLKQSQLLRYSENWKKMATFGERSSRKNQRAACLKWLHSISTETPDPASFKWFLRQYRTGQIKAELGWLENDLRDL